MSESTVATVATVAEVRRRLDDVARQAADAEPLPAYLTGMEEDEAEFEAAVDHVKTEVAAATGTTVEQLESRDRGAANARAVAMYLAYDETDLSLPAIGRAFGGRGHATVLRTIRRLEGEVPDDEAHRLGAQRRRPEG